MEYTKHFIGFNADMEVHDAEVNGLRIRIMGSGSYGVTMTGDINGRIVKGGFDTLEAAQSWVAAFLAIAETTPVEQSRYFVPTDDASYYSAEGKGAALKQDLQPSAPFVSPRYEDNH